LNLRVDCVRELERSHLVGEDRRGVRVDRVRKHGVRVTHDEFVVGCQDGEHTDLQCPADRDEVQIVCGLGHLCPRPHVRLLLLLGEQKVDVFATARAPVLPRGAPPVARRVGTWHPTLGSPAETVAGKRRVAHPLCSSQHLLSIPVVCEQAFSGVPIAERARCGLHSSRYGVGDAEECVRNG